MAAVGVVLWEDGGDVSIVIHLDQSHLHVRSVVVLPTTKRAFHLARSLLALVVAEKTALARPQKWWNPLREHVTVSNDCGSQCPGGRAALNISTLDCGMNSAFQICAE